MPRPAASSTRPSRYVKCDFLVLRGMLVKGEESVSLPAALFFRGWTTLRVPSLGTMDNLFVRVSLVICWMNSLRSPRTLPRVVATNANIELRCSLGTSICATVSSDEGNGTSSLSDRPTERPSKHLAFLPRHQASHEALPLHTNRTRSRFPA